MEAKGEVNKGEEIMYVKKRDGDREHVSFDKILSRLRQLGQTNNLQVNYTTLAMKIIEQLHDNISTSKIDELTAEQCASMATHHPDYGRLASLLVHSNHHKKTLPNFLATMMTLEHLLSDLFLACLQQCEFESLIDYTRDYNIDYFGFKTLENSYLLKTKDGIPVERVQHMWLRVAIAIHGTDMALVKETYDMMSMKMFTHATPTLFNAGTKHQQLSSCFLVAMKEDSLRGIYDTLTDCADISKWSGGIGLHIHNVRGKGSLIKGTNGSSNGIVPMLKVFNSTAQYINQGGKRNGSIAIYLEPWHVDIESFLELKKNHGEEDMRARDLFYGLWIPDLFMERVKNAESWSLFCPSDETLLLHETYGERFNKLYLQYEREGRAKKTLPARDLWYKILDAQMETGTPYLLYKDSCNEKSNQKNLGTIKSSNLCTEIIQYTSPTETSVCNLASIALDKFVCLYTKTYKYDELHRVAKVVTRNLNRVIDINMYPTEEARCSNFRHRPIGIGVQGLADVFALMDIAFTSEKARQVNAAIFETIYHAAVETSATEAEKEGPYSSFPGSPMSQGIFQFDMWPADWAAEEKEEVSYNWDYLRSRVMQHGVRNSLLVAPMPTASTSIILGCNECFEPFTSNVYRRGTLAGDFVVANKYLIQDLLKIGLWSEEIKNSIIANKGSVQHLDGLSSALKEKYKTVWEIPMKRIITMARDRAPFIDQSQSMNLWCPEPNYSILTSMHFFSWKVGLKTGMYYLRRRAMHTPQQFTIAPPANLEKESEKEKESVCVVGCVSCSA